MPSWLNGAALRPPARDEEWSQGDGARHF